MEKSLTHKEKQYVKKFVQEAEKMKTGPSGEWMAWAVFLLGGFVTVYVIMITQQNLGETTFFYVFFPGVSTGLLLMLCGMFAINISRRIAKKAREKKTLAEILTRSIVH